MRIEAGETGPRLRWRWIVLAWLVPAVIDAAQHSVAWTLRESRGVRFTTTVPVAIPLEFAQWLSWALLTPAIFALCERVPLRRPALGRALAIHLAAALVVAFAMEAVWYALRAPVLAYAAPTAFTPAVAAALFWPSVLGRLVTSSFIYATVAGVATALSYQHRLRSRELTAARVEAQLATAQVRALKMQLQPHFLFNALHAATVLVRQQPEAAQQMLTRLGDLLRLTLARAEHVEVTLASEIELLELYFQIEQTRFRDRLQVEYAIEQDLESALVPDLILQPLAENAIRHGVSETRGPATIRVQATRIDEWLQIDIEDNGRGLSSVGQAREGVGLSSARRRLEALYGTRHELQLIRGSNGGCLARLRIPFHSSGRASTLPGQAGAPVPARLATAP